MKGYVTQITAGGSKVLHTVDNLDWYRRQGNTVEFMRGPKPPDLRRNEELLAHVTGQTPQAEVVATVKLREGWIVEVKQ